MTIVLVAGLRFLVKPSLNFNGSLLLFIFPVIAASLFYGFRAGVLTTLLSIVTGTYFFLPPENSFRMERLEDYVTIVIYICEGLVISFLGKFFRYKNEKLLDLMKKESTSNEKQKIADTKVRELEANLSKVWRINTLGEMATGLAHELSQPITAIRNYASAIETINKKKSDPDIDKAIKGVISEAVRASEFIHSLRLFIGSRKPDKKLEEINEVISDVLTLIKSELNASTTNIRLQLTEPSLKVPIDKIQMVQVMLNLFRNSIDNMLSNSDSPREIFVGTSLQNKGVLLCVSDTGSGIPASEVKRIYEPFYTTKKNGMGMGLAISRSVIEIHDGKIWNIPNEPHGTTFMIWLPSPEVF
jgi:C4-dicarboxylate-specific signal transduction histidine kinase